eukprot:4128844-Amphidinium_carterae.1
MAGSEENDGSPETLDVSELLTAILPGFAVLLLCLVFLAVDNSASGRKSKRLALITVPTKL